MKAEIIAVGSELLTPDRVDTNSLFLTAQLNRLGIEVTRKTVVGDDLAPLRNEFDALGRFVERVAQRGEIIADSGLARDLDAEPVELRGEEKGIRVDPVWGQGRSQGLDYHCGRAQARRWRRRP